MHGMGMVIEPEQNTDKRECYRASCDGELTLEYIVNHDEDHRHGMNIPTVKAAVCSKCHMRGPAVLPGPNQEQDCWNSLVSVFREWRQR